MDTIKLFLAVVLLIAGISAYYLLSDQGLLYQVLALLALSAISIFSFLQTAVGSGIWGFVSDSRAEVRKVVWPTRQETIQTTLIVLFVVFLMGLLLWALDSFLAFTVRWLVGS